MSEFESLALLIADLNAQVRSLQQDNGTLHQENAVLREELNAERERTSTRENG